MFGLFFKNTSLPQQLLGRGAEEGLWRYTGIVSGPFNDDQQQTTLRRGNTEKEQGSPGLIRAP